MSLVYLCVFLLVCICILGFLIYVKRHEQFAQIGCGAILNKIYYYYYCSIGDISGTLPGSPGSHIT